MDFSERITILEPVVRAYAALHFGLKSVRFDAASELDCFAVASLTRIVERTEAAIHLIRAGADHSLPEMVRSILEAHAILSCISTTSLESNQQLLLQLKFVANKQAISTLELQLTAESLAPTVFEKMRDALSKRKKDQEELKANGISEIQIVARMRQIPTNGDRPIHFELFYKLLCDSAHHNLSSLQASHFSDQDSFRSFIAFNPISDSLYLMCLEEMLLAIQHSSVAFTDYVKSSDGGAWAEMIGKVNNEIDAFSLAARPIDDRFAY